MAVVSAAIPGALAAPALAVGQETRRAIAAGRPIMQADLAPAARVERNQIVPLHYRTGALSIVTEGRALDRGAEGQVISVMNLASRSRVTGRVMADGSVQVTGGAP
jgi:flagella basal body P-ring formation protein FlgA